MTYMSCNYAHLDTWYEEQKNMLIKHMHSHKPDVLNG